MELPDWYRTLQHQTAWVMLVAAIPWAILEPDRAGFMAMYGGAGAFQLFRLSRNRPRLRIPLLLFGSVAFGLCIINAPGGSWSTVPKEQALRVLLDIVIFHAAAALFLITRGDFPPRRE